MCVTFVMLIDDVIVSLGLGKTRSLLLVGDIWPVQFRRALQYLTLGKITPCRMFSSHCGISSDTKYVLHVTVQKP